jgi:hypothetical protein
MRGYAPPEGESPVGERDAIRLPAIGAPRVMRPIVTAGLALRLPERVR